MDTTYMIGAVVLALGSIAGLFGVLIKPIRELTESITALDVTMKHYQERMEKLEREVDDNFNKSRDSHRRIWEHNETQDEKLENHETRITLLEGCKHEKNH